VTFADEVGEPLEYLHPVETIAVKGLHTVVISNAMLRADMLRKDRTYELLITGHWLSLVTDDAKPRLECEIVFRGIHGLLELDLTARDKAHAGTVVPTFYSLAGEKNVIPICGTLRSLLEPQIGTGALRVLLTPHPTRLQPVPGAFPVQNPHFNLQPET
jgi:hypothetical protein